MTTDRRGSLVADPEGRGAAPATGRRKIATVPTYPRGHPVLHVAERCAFGATPELVAEIDRAGPRAWLEQQLSPDDIDDADCDARLQPFRRLQYTPEEVMADPESPQKFAHELRLANLVRAVHSRRQLFEVMCWFWTNHLNVPMNQRKLRRTKIVEDREVIRPHVLGRFEDMLLADAQSPAMLTYLDNDNSVAPAVNENYARELMELHTLGVDGGYTETDVRNAALVLSGLSVERATLRFTFRSAWADPAAIRVLDHDVPAGQTIDRPLGLLSHLAHHPSTARFLARKLCRFLVGESASDRLVTLVAQAYLASATDIPTTLRAIFDDDEFWASATGRLHPPFFAVAKAARALRTDLPFGADFKARSSNPLLWLMESTGQTPYSWPAPDGFPDADGYWSGPGFLAGRWNAYDALATNALEGVTSDVEALLAGARTGAEAIEVLAAALTCRTLAESERAELRSWIGDPDAPLAERPPDLVRHLATLVLSLPSSQHR